MNPMYISLLILLAAVILDVYKRQGLLSGKRNDRVKSVYIFAALPILAGRCCFLKN